MAARVCAVESLDYVSLSREDGGSLLYSLRSGSLMLRWEGWCCNKYIGRLGSTKGSSSSTADAAISSSSASFFSSSLWCCGAVTGVPVTMSASQSPSPPGAASIAVCGLYT
jgi:hypothetical protein